MFHKVYNYSVSDTMAVEIKEEIDINEDDISPSFSLGEVFGKYREIMLTWKI